MSRLYPLRCALTALLILISASFVQTATVIDIPFTDERVLVTPKTDWYVHKFTRHSLVILRRQFQSDCRSYWSYNGTVACPGIWTDLPDEKHMINLNFTGYGWNFFFVFFASWVLIPCLKMIGSESLSMGMPILGWPLGNYKSTMNLPKRCHSSPIRNVELSKTVKGLKTGDIEWHLRL